MNKTSLLNEIRYAERLCERTTRLYRHINATNVFLSILGGSSVISAAFNTSLSWLPIAGAITLAVFGAINLAMNPVERAAIAEADGKRYSNLRTQAHKMNEDELQLAINKLHEDDTAEVEALREIAYNDLAQEIGRHDAEINLRLHQKFIRCIA